MKNRIKALRKELGLTQEKFADRLSMKRNTIANYEIGRNEPIDAVISLICREFNVNEEWLRTGKGGPDNMFTKTSKDDEFTRAAKMISQDNDLDAMNAVIEYWKLDSSSKKAIWNFVYKLSKHMSDKNDQTVITPEPLFTNDNITEPESLKTILNSFPSENPFDINERKAVDTMRKALDDDHEDSSTQTG